MWPRPRPRSAPPTFSGASPRRAIRRRIAGAVLAAAVVVAGCTPDSAPEAGSDEELIVTAFARAAQESTARVELASELTLDASAAQELLSSEEVSALQDDLAMGSTTLEGAIDFAGRRATLGTSSVEAGFEPVAVFDDLKMHMPRSADAAQPWAVADFEDEELVAPSSDELPLGVTALSPYVLLELLTGVTDASAESDAVQVPGGVAATPYDVEIGWDQLLDDRARDRAGIEPLDDARRDGLMRIHEAMGLGGDGSVTAGRVWLDEQDLPRRFTWVIDQPLQLEGDADHSVDVQLTLTLDLLDFGEPVDIAVPTPDEVVQAQGFAQLVRESWTRAAGGGGELADGSAPGPQAGSPTGDSRPRRPPPGFPPPANDPDRRDTQRPGDGSGPDRGGDRQPGSDDDLDRYDIPPEVRRQIEEQQRR